MHLVHTHTFTSITCRHSETSPSAFAILNKLNSSNVLQLIPSSESLEARVQSTFLLYKTEDGTCT